MFTSARPIIARHLCHMRTAKLGESYTTSSLNASSVAFSGIQPTGVPHLGNYLGALRQWVQLQYSAPASAKLIFSIVDLHALTVRQDGQQLRQWKKETLAILLALGLNPDRCCIFYQSDISAHSELMWILSCTASMGYLSRMTQWKSKLALPENSAFSDSDVKAKLKLGLFSYPVLQAADMLAHGSTHVPVGEDQRQHVEFARECVQNFNSVHGRILVSPEVILSPAKRVMSLKEPHLKMSKSHQDPQSRILLTDHPNEIRAKIKAALTDSEPSISYSPRERPGVSNLLEIFSHLDRDHRTPEAVALLFKGASMRSLKEAVADAIVNVLSGVRENYLELISSHEQLNRVAEAGAVKARMSSTKVLQRIQETLGIK